jgi:large subunit ribosomal protein L10
MASRYQKVDIGDIRGVTMALRLEQKQAIVAEVNEAAQNALAAVLSDYRGLTVAEMTEMRAKARANGVYLRVIRNTLAKRAIAGTEYECLNEAFVGPTMVAFSQEDPGAAARLIKDYAKEFDALEVKALSIGGELLEASQLDRVATLPTRDEALALLMSVMQAPVTKLARTLNEVPGKLVRTLAAVGEQKQAV